ncbi:hypothetical protein GCM10025783_18610 [Amnibacterium soli]|uniref:Uncharacterized protein n=1 Tax=Amnibacterium soli TaxID=1282736 RepID=A0ABP8Z573_9MICO
MNGGRPVPVPEISTSLSLVVIVGILAVTVLASLLSPAGRRNARMLKLREHAAVVLDPSASLQDRRESKERIDDVHDEIEANRDDLTSEDGILLEKARSTRLR